MAAWSRIRGNISQVTHQGIVVKLEGGGAQVLLMNYPAIKRDVGVSVDAHFFQLKDTVKMGMLALKCYDFGVAYTPTNGMPRAVSKATNAPMSVTPTP